MTSPEDMARFQRALATLSRGVLRDSADRRAAFAEVTEAIATALPVERVGIWLYDAERTAIVLADLYERTSGAHSAGVEVSRDRYPRYFSALDEDRTIAAHDAMTDGRTSEFAADYLPSHGITSLLDAPILVDGACVGVVCHEHVGRPRTWTPAEQMFAGSAADFAALVIETHRRREAEAALRQREEELRAALEAARMGTWSWDVASGALTWSEQVSELFGLPPGQVPDFEGYLALLHPGDRDHVQSEIRRALERDTDYRVEHRVARPGGDVRWLEARGRVIREGDHVCMRGTVTDVTDRVALEQGLRQAQKLEGLGRLAGGVAHDFNNLLTVIVCAASMLEIPGLSTAEVEATVKEILDASELARKLTSKLLAFARKQPRRGETVDASRLLRTTVDLLERLVGEHISLEVEGPEEPLWLRVDESHFSQLIVNLAVNARDAMPDGGTLRIGLARVEPGQAPAGVSGGERRAGEGVVRLRVADTGPGIEADALARIFEPFFTTKTQGSGLGLSICHGIVHQAGGQIVVDSSAAGARFDVFLPLVSEPDAPAPVEDLASVRPPEGAPRLLVIEDERQIRRLLVRILEGAGYEVHAAADGPEALALAGRLEPVDAIVCDVVVPGAHGRDLFEGLLRAQPGAPILAISGHSDELGRDGVDRVAADFLPKPFSPRDLLERLSRILSRSR